MLETVLAILVAAAFCCYLVYRWQEAVMAPPPYQEPVKEEQAEVTPNAAWPFPTSRKP